MNLWLLIPGIVIVAAVLILAGLIAIAETVKGVESGKPWAGTAVGIMAALHVAGTLGGWLIVAGVGK